MCLMRRTVPLLVVLMIGFMGGRAEASRMGFNGLGQQGAIIWDDNGDVSTMANDCGGTPGCDTSVFGLLPIGFGIQVTTDDPGGLAGLNITALHLLLSVSDLPLTCGPASDVGCGPLSAFAGLSDFGWTVLGDPSIDGDDRVANSQQGIIRLLMQGVPGQAGFYELTQTSQTFLTTLNQTILATSHVGVDITRFNPGNNLTPFAVETALPTTTPVPEPGTLLLLGTGMAVTFRARRRIR